MLTVVVVVVNAPLEEVVTDVGTAVVPVIPVKVILLPAIPIFVAESVRLPDIVTCLLGCSGIVLIVRVAGLVVTLMLLVAEFPKFPATSKVSSQ